MGCTQSWGDVCRDVRALLHRLNIPPQEQAILWRMAIERVGCNGFKDILSSLQNGLAKTSCEA